jgi:hypothetical protein
MTVGGVKHLLKFSIRFIPNECGFLWPRHGPDQHDHRAGG